MCSRPMMMRALSSKAERSAVLALQRRRGRITRTDSHLRIDLYTENTIVDHCKYLFIKTNK
jgi:hypothetical protein